ncbi:MAG: cytochrome P450 [Pseudomonadota bacterium]
MSEFSLESFFTPDIIADPYPMYNGLRESSPVLYLEDSHMLILSEYQTAQAALRDKNLGHNDSPDITPEELEEIMRNPAIASLRRTMLLMNPPDHTRIRSLFVKAFDARSVKVMEERISALSHELIDQFIERGEGDLVKLFNHPLPVIVICDMLGIPEADRQQFISGTRIQGRLIDPTPMTDAELAQANANSSDSLAYFAGLCDARRANPQDDLLTALVQSETEHGALSEEELVANISLLFAAGHETTVNLLGNALLALYRNPDQLAMLKANPELMTSAVEEFLRYDSSVQLSARGALVDTEVAGHQVPAGTQILTLLAAANRDPKVFDDPDRLDITRSEAKPLSFGGGIHLCLGAQLARLETKIGLGALLERLPNLQLTNVDKPEWKQTITLRGQKSLPATW